MRIHWVFAHPDQRSLHASLRDEGLRTLEELGHEYRVSDLHALGFKAVLDAEDFPGHPAGDRLFVGKAQEQAYRTGELHPDVRAEQEKLDWADVVVLQFPLWWFAPPAILKGWFDRVLTQGFAFGVTAPDGHVRRYGDGGLAGKRGLVVTSVGARESGFGPRGIHGSMEEVLFPVLHGTLWYTGIAPLPPLSVYGADRAGEEEYERAAKELRDRLRTLGTTDPLPYRSERGGDYDDDLVLYPGVAGRRTGVAAHRSDAY